MPQRVVSHEQVVEAGARQFLHTASLDVDALAAEMSVSRSTLYRVIGSRDRLFGDVLNHLSGKTFAAITADLPAATTVDSFLAVFSRMTQALMSFGPLLKLIHREPELAFRVLLMPEAGLHTRSLARVRRLLDRVEGPGGEASPRLMDDVAYFAVRITESIVLTDLLAGREPNVQLAHRLVRTLIEEAMAAPDDSSRA